MPDCMDRNVIIVGAGPTGLMLAGELALAGVDVAIVERRADQEIVGSRAGGLHSRTIEILDQRGIAERFLSQGITYPVVHFADTSLDISDFPTRHNYVLGLFQSHIERILAGWIDELGVHVHRGREVTGCKQDDAGVDVELSDGSLRAQYLVGCDGGRSLIRKAAGIEFPGWDPTTSWLIAEAEVAEQPVPGIHHDARGFYALNKLDDGGAVRLVVGEQRLGPSGEPSLRDVSESLIAVCGTDYGMRSPKWISRFTDMARQAASYRDRRVLLAGDAAGLTNPVTGAGIAASVQSGTLAGEAAARWLHGDERALSDYEEELADTFDGALSRALRQRHRVLACYGEGAAPQPAALRGGWISYPQYWAA